MKMFDLDLNYLKDERILDCPAGASSFTAELSNSRYNVIATDILYGIDHDALLRRNARVTF